jgi:hypothetical protein
MTPVILFCSIYHNTDSYFSKVDKVMSMKQVYSKLQCVQMYYSNAATIIIETKDKPDQPEHLQAGLQFQEPALPRNQ